ncbi:MAG: hypothetical protein JJ975_04350 [Bacteroidia bacterium]|nr:hypothetical protein [Bacteroidia bacterium]
MKPITKLLLSVCCLVIWSCGDGKRGANIDDVQDSTVLVTAEVFPDEDVVNDYVDVSKKYQPKINQLKAAGFLFDSLNSWQRIDSIKNCDSFFHSYGNHVVRCISDSLIRYELTVYGEMGESRLRYYLVKDSFLLYASRQEEYIYPEDRTYQDTSLEFVEIESGNEVLYEDSYFVNDSIVYQNSHDCGAPNAAEYVSRIQKEALADVRILRTLFPH